MLAPGDRLGPYEILALLGVGGMGEVYRGRDARLGRDVALKVIAPKFAGDAALRSRFEREARAASALNHPAIVTIYDVGETDGVSWIAMEWVEGHTLRQALAGGALSIADARSIARQVAAGLAAAHDKGIVHRDLKPENVMLGADGRAKILDFGLARQEASLPVDDSHSTLDTMAAPAHVATVEGAIMGTVGYMSPEQASGRGADARADQFAFGVLLYEMLSGRRAFERATAVETLAAIIREEPVPLSSLRGDVPASLQAVVSRCLAKHPPERYASTRDLVKALDVTSDATTALPVPVAVVSAQPESSPQAVRPVRTRGHRFTYLLAGAGILAVAAVAWRFLAAGPAPIDTLAVLPFENRNTDEQSQFLGDELAESLIDQMSRVPSLTVMARGTAFRFKGSKDPQGAGRALGVGAVVSGTVSRRGSQLIISAELIDVATGARLWGQTYDRPFTDVLGVQASIATEIATGLRLRLSHEEKRTLGGQGTESAEAYELVLKARFLLSSDSEEGDLEARALYQRAIERDPNFVDAHLGLAGTYMRSAGNGYAPPAEAWKPAEAALRRALALDPGNVRARASLAALVLERDWDWATADREFRALSADPRLFLGNQYQPAALFFWARGRPDESVTLLERALRIDPGNLESRIMLADFLAQAGRLDDAAKYYRAILDVAASDPRPLFGLAEVLRRRGELPGAIDALRTAYELTGEEAGSRALASARTEKDYASAETAAATARLRDLQALAAERYVSPLDIARLQAQLGEREKAFEALRQAFEERSPMLILLKVDHAWDRIRDDPRFAELVRRVGIP